jgi:hypothetical protein
MAVWARQLFQKQADLLPGSRIARAKLPSAAARPSALFVAVLTGTVRYRPNRHLYPLNYWGDP